MTRLWAWLVSRWQSNNFVVEDIYVQSDRGVDRARLISALNVELLRIVQTRIKE